MRARGTDRVASTSARLVLAWAARYTRGLPPDIAADRRLELTADLHDQLADAAHLGLGRITTSRTVVRRMLLGVPADLSWRHDQLRVARGCAPSEADMAIGSFSRLQVGITVLALPFLALSLIATSVIVSHVTQPGPHEVPLWAGLVALGCAGTISGGLALQVRHRRVGLILVALGVLVVGAMLFWLPPVWMVALVLTALVGWEVTRSHRATPALDAT
ncbi:MAG: hypothetical protein OEY23_20375 [Acidimicrobiia bacterium]|nr:hypothetical protein [Acidimicrobiia bacterium]